MFLHATRTQPQYGRTGFAGGLAILLCLGSLAPAQAPETGRATENRFPPLKVPPGFKATLFACDPLIAYPSVIAAGPRPGAIFVAVDYMTGLGKEIVRRDEIRLVEDTNGDGYADRAPVYAAGFNSIQGLAYHDGTVYVMHAPRLTALADTDGDGVAEARRDLLTGLGLPPEDNPVRLHCANGVVTGHDGWLYLALGDHGCSVPRPEGDRLVFEGGGILRCRRDGRDLHVFATGLRNIYDVALDEELNVFVRDNENDGGDYKIRVCHSFFGADHGYPYLYYERPEETMRPLADLGLGSSAGGACYLETAFPPQFRGDLFFCEWGRSVVRYRPERSGASYAQLEEIEFAAGAQTDPYGFKPTDVVVARDGALFVADWADGQRPKRGRGRIYRITYDGPDGPSRPKRTVDAGATPTLEQWITQLDSTSHYDRIDAQAAIQARGREGTTALLRALRKGRIGVRGRLHAIWILARADNQPQIDALFGLAQSDPTPRVRAQAVRALADLLDPVLRRHRLDAGPGDAAAAARIAALAQGSDPRVVLEAVIAVGRLGWREAPAWLQQTLRDSDNAIAHAAMQALRRSENWPAVLKLLDAPDDDPVRPLALRAIADRFAIDVVDGLIERLRSEPMVQRRREYADVLTRVHKRPGPWRYWGYRPAPRPPNTVAWDRTAAIERALDGVLADADPTVRFHTLRRMQRETIPMRLATLGPWLRVEYEPEAVAAILESLRDRPASAVRELLTLVVRRRAHTPSNRLEALTMLTRGLDPSDATRLPALARILEDGPVLAAVLREIGQRRDGADTRLLMGKLASTAPEVRTAAVEALAALDVKDAGEQVRGLLGDRSVRVRRAAAAAVGRLGVSAAIDELLSAAQDADPRVRRASLNSLRILRDPRAVPLAVGALSDDAVRLAALDCIGDLADPRQAHALTALAKQSPTSPVLSKVIRILTAWREKEPPASPTRRELDDAVAEVQGVSGTLNRWSVVGSHPPDRWRRIIDQLASSHDATEPPREASSGWRTAFAVGTESRVEMNSGKTSHEDAVWIGYTDALASAPTPVQFLGSSSGTLRVWLNGHAVHQREQSGAFRPDSDRFDATLREGVNRLVVAVSRATGPVEFHLRFRRRSSDAEKERLAQVALTRKGNPTRGRKVFLDAEKSQCTKCHRMGDIGEPIGPDLTGVGSRFSRIHLIEAILEPSRAIAPSYETVAVRLRDGRSLSGVRVAETPTTLTLGDAQGQQHVLATAEIEARQPQSLSIMPEGLEKGMTADMFVDLIEFLVSRKKAAAPSREIDWDRITRVVRALPESRPDGEAAVLDALEQRARAVLTALDHPTDRAGWQQAVPGLRRKLRASIGIDRLPTPQPRNIRVVGVLDRGPYVIERIVYETFPDTPVPAHLYRPAKVEGKLPAVLFVPGHWWADSKTRPDFQALCINLARMGFVVLTYDPFGQGERGISFRDHRRTPLLLLGVSQQGIVVFESQCALAYLLSRPEVDPGRIGITGASGGGYNSWTMTALDARIAVSVPVVGTSEFFEQLHVCRPLDWYQAREHCHFVPGLLGYANNHELLALAAPRPVLVISAHNDESFPIPGIREVVRYGESLYAALGATGRFGYFEDSSTGHGYQKAKREAAYGWFLRWLKGRGDAEPVTEPPTTTVPYDAPELRCFPPGRNQPAGPGIIAQARRMIDRLPPPAKAPAPAAMRETLRDALGIEVPTSSVALHRGLRRNAGNVRIEQLRWNAFDGLEIPAVLVTAPGPLRGAVLAASDMGRESLLENPAMHAALASGLAVVLVDVRGTGELAITKPGWAFAVSLLLGENFVGRQALDLVAGRRALETLAELRGKPIGLLGSGPFASMAALFAAVLDPDAAWLLADRGFTTYRSFLDRPASMQRSFALAHTREQATVGIDREIPHALFVFDALRRFDLPDLFASISPRPVLVARPINGDWQAMSRPAIEQRLATGRFRWPGQRAIVADEPAERDVTAFINARAAGDGSAR